MVHKMVHDNLKMYYSFSRFPKCIHVHTQVAEEVRSVRPKPDQKYVASYQSKTKERCSNIAYLQWSVGLHISISGLTNRILLPTPLMYYTI